MATDPLDDVVRRQYERWTYPHPIDDIPAWLENNWQWFDPSHAYRMMWPDSEYRSELRILVAGCGTNQAAVIAYTNPRASVVAIDVSENSLEHHRFLAEKYSLDNLTLQQLPIERVGELGLAFDLIISTGVLHHLEDPLGGLRSLAGCLAPDGVIALMLYARYGRLGVEMVQSVVRDLGFGQDEESLRGVREVLSLVNPSHPVNGYLDIAPDLGDDAGVVDTFLHGREATFTVDQCRELVASAGLEFQDLFIKAPYYAHRPSPGSILTAITQLPREKQWSVMERLNTRNGCHYFLACSPGRHKARYRIDFDAPGAEDYVPHFRHRCGLADGSLHRYNWTMPLNDGELALAQGINGHNTIAEIVYRASAPSGAGARAEGMAKALAFFRTIWQFDFVAIGLNTAMPAVAEVRR